MVSFVRSLFDEISKAVGFVHLLFVEISKTVGFVTLRDFNDVRF